MYAEIEKLTEGEFFSGGEFFLKMTGTDSGWNN